MTTSPHKCCYHFETFLRSLTEGELDGVDYSWLDTWGRRNGKKEGEVGGKQVRLVSNTAGVVAMSVV